LHKAFNLLSIKVNSDFTKLGIKSTEKSFNLENSNKIIQNFHELIKLIELSHL
jgi:hypothetical protein